jgi:hypothetical protein
MCHRLLKSLYAQQGLQDLLDDLRHGKLPPALRCAGARRQWAAAPFDMLFGLIEVPSNYVGAHGPGMYAASGANTTGVPRILPANGGGASCLSLETAAPRSPQPSWLSRSPVTNLARSSWARNFHFGRA